MWQRLRLLKPFWWVVLIASVVGLLFVVLSSLVADSTNQTRSAIWLRETLGTGWLRDVAEEFGPFASNDLVAAALIAALSGFWTTALIQIFKIPAIRRTAIQAIAFGYYENFLRKLVSFARANHTVYRIGIIMPKFELVAQPELYWEGVKAHIARLGFEMQTVETDASFGRNTHVILKRESPPMPLYIDVPTTARTLQEILELEAHMPVGRARNLGWFKRRFDQLRDEFSSAIRDYYPEDALRSLVFITPTSEEDFERKMTDLVQSLEQEIAALQPNETQN